MFGHMIHVCFPAMRGGSTYPSLTCMTRVNHYLGLKTKKKGIFFFTGNYCKATGVGVMPSLMDFELCITVIAVKMRHHLHFFGNEPNAANIDCSVCGAALSFLSVSPLWGEVTSNHLQTGSLYGQCYVGFYINDRSYLKVSCLICAVHLLHAAHLKLFTQARGMLEGIKGRGDFHLNLSFLSFFFISERKVKSDHGSAAILLTGGRVYSLVPIQTCYHKVLYHPYSWEMTLQATTPRI